ncbi:hypothetical protein FOA52_013042 [Chlamydomonas sp. UWO 241]|nr:hypothetical protein FOA52_013042 [Chlamydomonas sp. UWO 241]
MVVARSAAASAPEPVLQPSWLQAHADELRTEQAAWAEQALSLGFAAAVCVLVSLNAAWVAGAAAALQASLASNLDTLAKLSSVDLVSREFAKAAAVFVGAASLRPALIWLNSLIWKTGAHAPFVGSLLCAVEPPLRVAGLTVWVLHAMRAKGISHDLFAMVTGGNGCAVSAMHLDELMSTAVLSWVLLRLKGVLLSGMMGQGSASASGSKANRPMRLLDAALSAACVLIGLAYCSEAMALPMSRAITSLGAFGLIIGLASQELASNLVGGFSILLTQPFAVGDEIAAPLPGVGLVRGVVEDVGLMRTTLTGTDGSPLLSALSALYHHDDPKVKDEADRWLETWQQSTEAWSVADGVLHDAGSSLEAQYFCAQTLRTKVQRDFEELPPNTMDSLRNSLLALLIKHSSGKPPVRTQLCLALAAVCVHVPAALWGEGGALQWFGSKLAAVPPEAALPCLLELLTVLPQEANSHKVAVRPERRRDHANELASSTGLALQMLTQCLSASSGDRTKDQTLEAFGAWLRLAGGRRLPLEGTQLAVHPLTRAALAGLSSADTFYACVEAVCELIWVTVDPDTAAINEAMMPLIQVLVPEVMKLRGRFAIAARRLASEAPGSPVPPDDATDDFDDDEDTAKGMARLFAEAGEAYIFLIARATPEVAPPAEAMLEVAAYPNFSIASMSFQFWAKLARQLRPRTRPPDGPTRFSAPPLPPPPDATEEERVRRATFYRPAFEKLVVQTRGRLRYPSNWGSWSREEHMDFRRQRMDMADTLEDAAGVVGFGRCLQLLLQPLHALSAGVAQGQPFDWRSAEAVLFCVRSVAKHCTDTCDTQLRDLLRALPQLPATETQLLYTVCHVIAQYSPWLGAALNARTAEPEMPQLLLNMAVSALSRTESAGAGAKALAQLCDHCGPALLPVMDSLMALYRSALYAGACGQLAGRGSDGEAAAAARTRLHGMNDDDVHMLVGAVCSATQRCVSPERLGPAAASLMQPLMDLLQHVLPLLPDPAQGQPSAGLSKAFPYLAPLVDRVATVLQSFTRPDITAQLVTWAWPALDALVVRVGADAQVTERACRALRYGIKGSGQAVSGLLPQLLDALPQRFRATRHPAFLYIFSELVKIFGAEPGRDVLLAPVLQALLADATVGLTGLRQLESQPDLVDDVLLLVYRSLGYCPRIMLSPPAASLPGMLNVAMLGTLMQHREACCSSLTLFVRLLEPRTLEGCSPGAADARTAALLPRGPTLTRLLLAGVAGCVPFSRVTDIADALTAVLKACGPTGMQWLRDALQLLPSAAVAASDCTVLLTAASVVCAGDTMGRPAAALDGPLSEFAELCRRTKRCSQAAQRALLPPELLPEFGLQ